MSDGSVVEQYGLVTKRSQVDELVLVAKILILITKSLGEDLKALFKNV